MDKEFNDRELEESSMIMSVHVVLASLVRERPSQAKRCLIPVQRRQSADRYCVSSDDDAVKNLTNANSRIVYGATNENIMIGHRRISYFGRRR